MKRTTFAVALSVAFAGCAYPAVALRVESWDRSTRDGGPFLTARLGKDPGLLRLLQDYPGRVYLWLGPAEGDPADCILGARAPEAEGSPVFGFRLHNLHQCNRGVVLASSVALRLIVQYAFSYDVVAIVDGLHPQDIGLR